MASLDRQEFILLYETHVSTKRQFAPCKCIACHKPIIQGCIYRKHHLKCKALIQCIANYKNNVFPIWEPRLSEIRHNCINCNRIITHCLNRNKAFAYIICRYCLKGIKNEKV